jgi:hypothetical protein
MKSSLTPGVLVSRHELDRANRVAAVLNDSKPWAE